MKNEYKNIFNKIEPDERLREKVLDYNDKSGRIMFTPKKVIAVAAVVAIMITGGSISAYQLSVKPLVAPHTTVGETGSHSVGDFGIIAYADEDTKDAYKVIGEDDITLTDYKIELVHGDDGNYISGSSEGNGFAIMFDDDIESVTFKSIQGSFNYFDAPLKAQLVKEHKYYSAVIPITAAQFEEYSEGVLRADEEGRSTAEYKTNYIKGIIAEKDCTQYIYDENFDISNLEKGFYSAYVSDMAGEEENYYDYCILIADHEKTRNIAVNDKKELVAKTYSEGDKIEGIYYTPDEATDYLLQNPEVPYEKLPEDTITITVKYKTGQSITKELLAKFNSDGVLTLQYK